MEIIRSGAVPGQWTGWDSCQRRGAVGLWSRVTRQRTKQFCAHLLGTKQATRLSRPRRGRDAKIDTQCGGISRESSRRALRVLCACWCRKTRSRALDRRMRGRRVILVMAASFVRRGLYLPPHQGGWPSEKLNKWQKSNLALSNRGWTPVGNGRGRACLDPGKEHPTGCEIHQTQKKNQKVGDCSKANGSHELYF